MSGSEDEKTKFMQARGLELIAFIDAFIRKYNIHPISPDGKKGGCSVVGWSLGNSVSLAAIGSINAAPNATQARLAKYVRGLIIHGESSLFGPFVWQALIND
jgi:hypothetical protein